MQELIVVDEADRQVGTAPLLECHSGSGLLHRAFTTFIFNPAGELLLQRRSALKRLWPGCWEPSCSGHPLAGEELRGAAERRLREELGVAVTLHRVGGFVYGAAYAQVGVEREYCHLLVGSHHGEVLPDPREVAEYRWSEPGAALAAATAAGEYAPWLAPALEMVVSDAAVTEELGRGGGPG